MIAKTLRLLLYIASAAFPITLHAGDDLAQSLRTIFEPRISFFSQMRCEPTLPYFCGYAHQQIGCAEQSRQRTWGFTVEADGEIATATPNSGSPAPASLARSARVVLPADEKYLLLYLHPGRDYIKIDADGQFVFRYYLGSSGVMARGRCSNVTAQVSRPVR